MSDLAHRFVGVFHDRRTRVVALLWLLALTAVAVRIGALIADPSLPGEHWQTSDGQLEDFRDIVWAPGRYVLDGGNPYDPVPYLAEHPWAQQFSPYPPAWLFLGVLLGPLPFLVSAVVFQILSVAVGIVTLRVLLRWAMPHQSDLAVPAALLWINVWYPGRGSLASMGSVLAVLGIVLVLRSITRPRPTGDGPRPAVDLACAAGVAIALVKPHFGLLVTVVAIVAGRWREAWRGAAALVLASVPILAVVTWSAGGPVAFARSMARNLTYVHGTDTPGGVGSAFQRRFDLLGQLGRWGFTELPGWVGFTIPLVALVVAGAFALRCRDRFWLSTVTCSALLLGFFHTPYDLLLIIVPVALGLGMALRGELADPLARVCLGALTVVTLHLQSVSIAIVPGLDIRGADTLDVVLVVLALLLAIIGGQRSVTAGSPSRRNRRYPTATPTV